MKENVGYVISPFYSKNRAISVGNNPVVGTEVRLQMNYRDALKNPFARFYFEKKKDDTHYKDEYYIRTHDGLYWDSEHGEDIIDHILGIKSHTSKKIILSKKGNVFRINTKICDGTGTTKMCIGKGKNENGKIQIITFGDNLSTKGSDTKDVNLVRSENYNENITNKHNFYFELTESEYKPIPLIPEIDNKMVGINPHNFDMQLDGNARLFGTKKEQEEIFNNYIFELIRKDEYYHIKLKDTNKYLKFFYDRNDVWYTDSVSPVYIKTFEYTNNSRFIITEQEDYNINKIEKRYESTKHIYDNIIQHLDSKFLITKVNNGEFKISLLNYGDVGISTDNVPKEQDTLYVHMKNYKTVKFSNVRDITWNISPVVIPTIIRKENFTNEGNPILFYSVILLVIAIFVLMGLILFK
jgi:hypothetical protein